MALNLKPYKFESNKDNHYTFVTDFNAVYECYFISYAEYFKDSPKVAPFIYAVNLDINHPLSKKNVDRRIADTLITIVGSFLSTKINCVVYICDASDGKAVFRSKKFKSWFEYANLPTNKIVQISHSFTVFETSYYTAMLLHQQSQMKQEFIKAYFDFIDNASNSK